MDSVRRAVIYLRVSTSRQADKDFNREGYSIPSQREACVSKARSLNALVVDEYVDQGESARSSDRPAFQEMIARITRDKDVDYVVVHKVDRWARNREDDVLINMSIRKAGAILVSATENIDETPTGKLLHAFMAGMAEYYSANLASEVLKGTRQKARGGGTPYLAPVGYMNVGQFVEGREVRTVVPDPERAPLVLWAFQTYATGQHSIVALTDLLARHGLTTRPTGSRAAKPLVRSRVYRLLTNRYYLGLVRYQGVEYPGRHEGLVTPELFQRVQTILRSHDRVGDRQRKHHHYLKGSLRCGRCGSRLVLTRARSHSDEFYWYFFCPGRREGCEQIYAPVLDVETAVARFYGTIQLSATQTAELSERLHAAIASEMRQQHQHAQRERRRIAKLNAERDKVLAAYLAGAVAVDQLKVEQDRIARELADAKRLLGTSETDWADIEVAIRKVIDVLGNCQAAYTSAPNDVRRLFNQAFFKRIDVDMREVMGRTCRRPSKAYSGCDRTNRTRSHRTTRDGSRSQLFVPLVRIATVWLGREDSNL